MQDFTRLKKTVSAKVSPTAQEAREEKAFALKLSKILEGIGADRVSFVGSAARDTGLKGDNDIDLFVQFPTKMDEEKIVNKTFDFTKKKIKADWQIRYAEHPYLQAKIGKFKVEVIPCFTATPHGGIKSAVDRSPLHMDYLQKRLTAIQREDVRILKQLLKNSGLYGAEWTVKGFSGLVCEYLILNYRSFEKLVESAAKWKPPVRIDFDGDSEKQFAEPFVFIDAIDRNRNAGAIVSAANLNRFIALCRILRDNPSEKLFFTQPKRPSLSQTKALWKKRKTHLVLIDAKEPDLVEDIIAPQLAKTRENICKRLQERGFKVFDCASFVQGSKAFVLIEVENDKPPSLKKIFGPPVWNEKAVLQFLKGKKGIRGPYIQEDRVVMETSIEGKTLVQILGDLKKNPVKWGVASHYAKPFKSSSLKLNEGVFSKAIERELGAYFARKESWW